MASSMRPKNIFCVIRKMIYVDRIKVRIKEKNGKCNIAKKKKNNNN